MKIFLKGGVPYRADMMVRKGTPTSIIKGPILRTHDLIVDEQKSPSLFH